MIFLIDEADDGIVSITSPETLSNLTLSSYQVNQSVTEKILEDFFSDITNHYEACSELMRFETKQDFLIEKRFTKENIHWIWWGLSKSNQITLISVNSEIEVTDDDYNLYRFMISKMEIYPTETV